MKINCEMVQDLLPLYEDGVCSESSRAAVEEHLKNCESCRCLRAGAAAIPATEITLETETKAADGLRKVRRRWRASLLAVLLILPLLLLIFNEIRGSGPVGPVPQEER